MLKILEPRSEIMKAARCINVSRRSVMSFCSVAWSHTMYPAFRHDFKRAPYRYRRQHLGACHNQRWSNHLQRIFAFNGLGVQRRYTSSSGVRPEIFFIDIAHRPPYLHAAQINPPSLNQTSVIVDLSGCTHEFMISVSQTSSIWTAGPASCQEFYRRNVNKSSYINSVSRRPSVGFNASDWERSVLSLPTTKQFSNPQSPPTSRIRLIKSGGIRRFPSLDGKSIGSSQYFLNASAGEYCVAYPLEYLRAGNGGGRRDKELPMPNASRAHCLKSRRWRFHGNFLRLCLLRLRCFGAIDRVDSFVISIMFHDLRRSCQSDHSFHSWICIEYTLFDCDIIE